MGFENVYKCLREVFPEVDHRILRAVALENPKDVHVAVNDVLTEVIPRFREDIIKLPSQDPFVESVSEIEVENKTKIDSLRHEQMDMDSLESGTTDSETSDDTFHESSVAHLDAALNQSVSENNYIAGDDCEQSRENTETTSLTVPAGIQEDSSEVGLNHVAPGKSNGLVYEHGGYNKCEEIRQFARIVNQVTEDIKQDKTLFHGVDGSLNDFHSHVIRDLNTMLMQELYSVKSNFDSFPANGNSDSQIANPCIANHSPVQSEIHLNSESDHQKSNANGTSNPGPQQECSTGELSVIEDGLMGHTIITQSGQPCNIDLLDETIEDAKNNKIMLFSAMQSVINEMKELEHKEKYVEKVKEEAANGESEILAKVEQMKRTVVLAKEANDMNAGEVYGEKAILATETRELQSRLLSLSDERDKSLSILDEMHTTLKARIAAVDAMLKATEEEKLAKEKHAQKALAEKEALMEMVVQESMILRREAEENSKLREFLIHRGQVVDILQGEISVICQDVRQLKEKFDLEVPLSKSLSSSQTSCILASSGSSLKSATCDVARFCLPLKDIVPSNMDSETGAPSNPRKEGSRASSVTSSRLSSNDLEEKRGRSHFKELSDDGWDVFDKEAEFADAPYFVDAKE